ncbi:unnamed protein product, partial [Ceratitis capitata]
ALKLPKARSVCARSEASTTKIAFHCYNNNNEDNKNCETSMRLGGKIQFELQIAGDAEVLKFRSELYRQRV